MNNKSKKNIIIIAVTAVMLFGFTSNVNAGTCDHYEVVPTCMGSGTGGSVMNYGYGGNYNNYNNNYNNNNNYYREQAPSVVTKNPLQVSTNSIRMNGFVSSESQATVFFEYGTTRNLGSRTNSRIVGSMDGDYDALVTGLKEDTIYYYRIVAENNGGSSVGNIVSINTSKIVYTTTNNNQENVTVRNTTVTRVTPAPAPTRVVNTTVQGSNSTIMSESSLNSNGLSALSLHGYNSFFPDTIFEWILTVLLILAIIILVRQLRPKSIHP